MTRVVLIALCKVPFLKKLQNDNCKVFLNYAPSVFKKFGAKLINALGLEVSYAFEGLQYISLSDRFYEFLPLVLAQLVTTS